MDTHKNRKDAARKALKRAIDDGCLYEDIASATDIDSVSLRGFASHGKLGPDKTIALLGHLTEHGYMKEPQTNLRLLPSVDQPDPGLILAKQFSILADIWASGFFDAMQGCPPNVLKELMGHSDITMTLGYYVDVDMGRMAEWSQRHTG